MKNIFFAAGLALLAWRFVRMNIEKAKGIENWDYKIRGLRIMTISAQKITGVVLWDFVNTSNLDVKVQNVDLVLKYNGVEIGSGNIPGPIFVEAKGSTSLDTAFVLNIAQIGAVAGPLVAELAQKYDVPVNVSGKMSLSQSGLPWITIPYSINTTAKTIYSLYI